MITENDILEPSKAYKLGVKESHHQNVVSYFDGLVKQAGVSREKNKETVERYNKKLVELEKLKNFQHKIKVKKGWLIFLTVLLFVTIIAPILLIKKIKSLNKDIAKYDEKIKKCEEEANAIKEEAQNQLYPLYELFEWNMPATLMSKTVPLIQMDKTFDPSKYQYMHEKYGFDEEKDPNVSSVYVQSGSILGNPFLIERNYCTCMYQHDYVGHLTITWTTTSTDSEGHVHTTTHTQTLTAHIYKPAPRYYLDTWLIYANGAAPDLSFTRNPSGVNSMSDKQIERYIKDYDKKLDKLERDAVKNNKSFHRLQNPEFEALFNCLNRDHEPQFRLLFTPLAQRSMCDLIRTKTPYGDDFTFIKRKCLNYIQSAHSQGINLDGNPANFFTYDLEAMESKFISECDDFMQSMFYDLAPLLSIPLYQQHKDFNYIYKDNYKGNITSYETEVLANKYDENLFLHEKSKTHGILKTEFVSRDGNVDKNIIHAYSYDSIEHLDFVPTMGGDGHMHNVPVTWYEYIPLHKETPFAVTNTNKDLNGYRDWRSGQGYQNFVSRFVKEGLMNYQRGLMSFIPSNTNVGGKELSAMFNKK